MIYPPKELANGNFKFVKHNKQEHRQIYTYESKTTPNLEINISYSRSIGVHQKKNTPVAEDELQNQFNDNCEGQPVCIQARHLPAELCSMAKELLAEGFDMAGIILPTTKESQNTIGFQMIRGEKLKGHHTAYLFVWRPDSETVLDLAFKWRRENVAVVVSEVNKSQTPISTDN